MSTDYAAYLKEWKRRNPEKVKEYARRYSKKHSKALAVKSLAWKQKNIDRARMQDKERQRAVRRENPELTAARRAAAKVRRIAKQEAIAGRPRPAECELCALPCVPVFDHCHARGHFRGWLCDRCNRTLGQVKDSPLLLRKMARYLEIGNGQTDRKAA